MHWLNLHVEVLDSPEFLGAEPVERATWLCLMRYCVGQENGGRIVGCREWGDRKWQQIVRVTREETSLTSELWRWDGDDIVVAFYDADREQEIQRKRLVAKENGKSGGRPKTQEEPTLETNEKPTLVNSAKAERKGKEDNGKELIPPIVPQGGQQKPKSVPTTEEAKRIAAIYHRRDTTGWSDNEIRAFKKLMPIDHEDLSLVEDYYAGESGNPDNILRTALLTFLNNFRGEVDRARTWAGNRGSSTPQRRPCL